ncbi:MAG: R3H domain-containing nucleic acid-binding protein [Candidatus Promineifilaceae bacterium]
MQHDEIGYIVEKQARGDLDLFLNTLPDSIRECLTEAGRSDELLELVMDFGRSPTARFVDGEIVLREAGVTIDELEDVVLGISDFDDDNRAGIARTLHRIAGIRNRRGRVIGLTCRIGRAVYGTVDILEDIIAEGKSLLILGAPGVGKTTMLREISRILAETKRVVIVDTSNEIGGDGDIPHPAVGRARRMQVPRPSHQHETMIEAVENHNPQVIVIDEIGREEEAAAARTINERGVMLIGTAHGRTLDNLLLNPTLSDLVGGIESVTLSDEEARRRGTQKTVLERRSSPTFETLIELQGRQELTVHRDVAASVDAMLRGRPLGVELRYRDEEGTLQIESRDIISAESAVTGRRRDLPKLEDTPAKPRKKRESQPAPQNGQNGKTAQAAVAVAKAEAAKKAVKRVKLYSYGVARNRLQQAAARLNIQVETVDHLNDADMMVTLKSYYRKHRKLIADAERQRKPVYILRANTINQMESFLSEALDLGPKPTDPFEAAIQDANLGIERVQAGEQSIDLAPVGSAMRRYQHQMARQANLVSHSYGREPNRHVRIFNVPRNESIPGMGDQAVSEQ